MSEPSEARTAKTPQESTSIVSFLPPQRRIEGTASRQIQCRIFILLAQDTDQFRCPRLDLGRINRFVQDMIRYAEPTVLDIVDVVPCIRVPTGLLQFQELLIEILFGLKLSLNGIRRMVGIGTDHFAVVKNDCVESDSRQIVKRPIRTNDIPRGNHELGSSGWKDGTPIAIAQRTKGGSHMSDASVEVVEVDRVSHDFPWSMVPNHGPRQVPREFDTG